MNKQISRAVWGELLAVLVKHKIPYTTSYTNYTSSDKCVQINLIVPDPDYFELKAMTSKDFHKEKIVPLRMKLKLLEKEYENLFRKECGEKIGETASCNNCAFSCVIDSRNDHNCCMGGKCTCCNDWCYSWTPENEVSKFLRNNYQHDEHTFYRLEDIFGDRFLQKCDNSKNVAAVMKVLKIIAEFDGKLEER